MMNGLELPTRCPTNVSIINNAVFEAAEVWRLLCFRNEKKQNTQNGYRRALQRKTNDGRHEQPAIIYSLGGMSDET